MLPWWSIFDLSIWSAVQAWGYMAHWTGIYFTKGLRSLWLKSLLWVRVTSKQVTILNISWQLSWYVLNWDLFRSVLSMFCKILQFLLKPLSKRDPRHYVAGPASWRSPWAGLARGFTHITWYSAISLIHISKGILKHTKIFKNNEHEISTKSKNKYVMIDFPLLSFFFQIIKKHC